MGNPREWLDHFQKVLTAQAQAMQAPVAQKAGPMVGAKIKRAGSAGPGRQPAQSAAQGGKPSSRPQTAGASPRAGPAGAAYRPQAAA